MTTTPTTTSGVVLIDKPEGPTSRDVLDELERSLGLGPLGHAGTLDPKASGLLVVLVGGARRLQQVFVASSKAYEATIELGAVSETLDGEGPVAPSGVPIPPLSQQSLADILQSFLGEVTQVPPAYSAVRLAGRRAHELAREGRPLELEPRQVFITGIEITALNLPRLSLRITCGPGTYIRSLARDLGDAIGCGAYLTQLRRIRSGRFDVLDSRVPKAVRAEHVFALSVALAQFGRLDVDRDVAIRLGHGQKVEGLEVSVASPGFAWFGGEPFCRLKKLPGGFMRSDLRLGPIPPA